MAFTAKVLKVLIASPSDTRPFRDAVEQALKDWNAQQAETAGVVLLPRRWETNAVPLLGADGQSVINSQLVDDADIVIGIFHARLGYPTRNAVSGTAEELQRSSMAGKPVHVYFATMPIPYDHDVEQFSALQHFKKELQDVGLLGTFSGAEDLMFQVRTALALDVPKASGGAAAADSRGPRGDASRGGSRSAGSRERPGATALNEQRQDLFFDILNDVGASLDIRRPARGERNWLPFSSGSFGYWSLVVTKTRRLRVEAYLDTGDKELNKALFDEVHAERGRIERDVGSPLSWERLDDSRASRIAAYSAEAVALDDSVVREGLRAWAGPMLVQMFRALDGDLRERSASLKATRART